MEIFPQNWKIKQKPLKPSHSDRVTNQDQHETSSKMILVSNWKPPDITKKPLKNTKEFAVLMYCVSKGGICFLPLAHV